ncbi:MAG: ferrochelatase [Myxococcales bacterium]|nr:ferrochelatase [Myxococcales bacterium]
MTESYDAFLLVGFGGPEQPDDVLPFLEVVLRGRGVPEARMLEVAEHYYAAGGKSPINEQARALAAAISADFKAHGVSLPVFWGNRNWHPLLTDVVPAMKTAGIRRALAFPTSAFSSYSGCRQYQENLADACRGLDGLELVTMRRFFNHPRFIEAWVACIRPALAERPDAKVLFSAHSIPLRMADACAYERELRETCRLVAEEAGIQSHALVFQSRSGSPREPWLGPDILAQMVAEAAAGTSAVIVLPIGFVSDHMEILHDLDHAARSLAEELNLPFTRAPTVGTHASFVAMVRELVLEYVEGVPRAAIGNLPPSPAACAPECCPRVSRPIAVSGPRSRR